MAKERIPSVYPSSESETDSGVAVKPQRTRPIPSITDLGKRVIFTSGNDKKEKYGTLRYLGRPEFSKGSWCGIELDDAKGKNNGSVRGIRYFSCPQDCGIFVPVTKVELDPSGETRTRTKSTATGLSLVEKRARKNGGKYAADKKNSSPFFYNTMPRSLSIPALNQGFIALDSSRPSPEHRPTRTIRTSRPPLSPIDTMPKRFPHMSPLKKYTSEMNISSQPSRIRSPKTTSHPVDIGTPTTPITSSGRRQMGSFSEVQILGGFPSNGLRSSNSCHNLLSASVGTRKLSSSKPQFKRILSPRTSPPSGHTHHQLDSEDGVSYYSSTSDLSHEDISSDSDLTPRSSSNSPCFIDVQSTDLPFLLKPPSPPSSKSSTSLSPTHIRAGLPTGLATPTSTIIESSRGVGSNGDWCRLPSPEHQKNSKIFQSTRSGKYTLEHPLVNGHVAADNGNNKENEMGGATENRGGVNENMDGASDNKGDVFICPSSGQEMTTARPTTTNMSHNDMKRLQDDISSCLKNQVAMEARIGRMEESLLQFQAVFMRTMETMQETLKQQMEFNQLQRAAANGSRHVQYNKCDQGLGHLVCNNNTGDATN